MVNHIYKLSELDSVDEFYNIFKKYEDKIKVKENITFPSVDILRFSFDNKNGISKYFLNISINDYKDFLKDYFNIFSAIKYTNTDIYNQLNNGFTISNGKHFNLDKIFKKEAIKEFQELWGITEREAYLCVIHTTKLVLVDNELRKHRVLGGSSINAKRKTLGYTKLYKSLAIKTLRKDLVLSDDASHFEVKLITEKDIKLISSIHEYLSFNKTSISNLYIQTKLEKYSYLVLKVGDLSFDSFFNKYESTIKELFYFDIKGLKNNERKNKKQKLFDELKKEMISTDSRVLFIQNQTTNYCFKESKVNRNRDVFEKIDLDIASGYNVYKNVKTGDLISFDEKDAYDKLYDDRANIFKNFLIGNLTDITEDVKNTVKERVENGYDSDKFKSFHMKATKDDNAREKEIQMLKNIWMPFFNKSNLPKGSYDKRNEYALNYLILKYKNELGYEQAFQQLKLRCLSGNSVNPDNACVFDGKLTLFDLKTSYIEKSYQAKSEKELLVLLSAYDSLNTIIQNKEHTFLKSVSSLYEKTDDIKHINNFGFYIHFGERTEIISEKRRVINMVDFSYFEITLIFSDFVRLVTLEMIEEQGNKLTKKEMNEKEDLKRVFIDIMVKTFKK